jgi:hypothetical protein
MADEAKRLKETMITNVEDLTGRLTEALAACDALPPPPVPTMPPVVTPPSSGPVDDDDNDQDDDDQPADVNGDIKSDVGGVKVALSKYALPSGSDKAPFDPTKNWTLGPQQWNYKYSSAKKFWNI